MTKELGQPIKNFKFNLKWGTAIEEGLYLELEKWRVLFFKMNLIGESSTTNSLHGDVSRRLSDNQDHYIITGKDTQRYSNLTGSHYTKVTKCDEKKGTADAIGPIAPSSEAITHYFIYKTFPQVKSIFHLYNLDLWNYMKENDYATTKEDVFQDVEGLELRIKRIIKKSPSGIFAFSHHPGEFLCYATSSDEAGKIILDLVKQSKK